MRTCAWGVRRTALAVVVALVVLASPSRRALASGVVGTGDPSTCTEGALDSALAGGGTVTFNCGASPFTLAVQAGRLSTRPYIPMLEEHNARQGFVDHGSFLALQDALPDHLKDPLAFLYFSGWRISEMRGLEWRDVDLAGRVVRLRPELSKNKDGRVLPLSGELLDVIERAAEQRRLDCTHVFHVDGQPIGDVRKAWWRACITAGLGAMVTVETPGGPKRKYQGVTRHDLRRSAIRNMVRAGIPERVCMALSGHKTRAIFERYNIVSEADLATAADQLHSHLQQQRSPARVVPLKASKAGA